MSDTCVNCDNEAKGRSKYCSDRCKVAHNRNKSVTDVTVTVESVTVPPVTVTASIEHYYEHPDLYITRAHPERLNWGEYMNYSQLQDAGLNANRVSIPGDWDYDGVYTQAGTPYTRTGGGVLECERM